MNANKIWHDASEEPMVDKTFLLVSPNGNSSLCLWGGKELLSVTLGGGHSVLCKGDKWAYIDDIINLQEEPISEDLEKEINNSMPHRYCWSGDGIAVYSREQMTEFARHIARWQQQKDKVPVSEDLEEAAITAANEDMQGRQIMEESNENRQLYSRIFRRGFKAGSKWQKQQDQSTIELAEDHAYFAGSEAMREKMMEDAIETEVLTAWSDGEANINIPIDAEKGDIIKVIIIKDE